MNSLPVLNTNGHILFIAPQGRIAVFSVEDAILVFQYLPLNTEVYAIDLPAMKVERVICVYDAANFFVRMKE